MKKLSVILTTIIITTFQILMCVFAQDTKQHPSEEFVLTRLGKGWIKDIEFSPDGEQIAVATTIGIWIYNSHTGEIENQFEGFIGNANAISYSPDGQQLAAAHQDLTIRIWEPTKKVQKDKIIALRGHQRIIHDIKFSFNGKKLASASSDKSIRLWDIENLEEDNQSKRLPYKDIVRTVTFSSDSQLVAGGSDDGIIQVWDANTGDSVYSFSEHKASVQVVDFSFDRTKLASASLDGSVILWSLVGEGGKIQSTITHDTPVYTVKFSPDGNTFATGTADRLIRLWDTKTEKRNFTLRGHKDAVPNIDFSPDGTLLVSGSPDGTVFVWDILGERTKVEIHGHTGGIKALSYTQDNRIRACGTGLDGKLRIWDAGTSSELSILKDHIELTQAVAFSKDGERIASGGSVDGNIFLSNVLNNLNYTTNNDNRLESVFKGNPHGITALTISPANTILASGGSDGRIHLLNIATGRQLKILRGAQSTITALTFILDSTHLFSGEENGTIRYWNALTGKQVGEETKGSFSEITALAFSPNLRILAIGDKTGTITLFDHLKDETKTVLSLHTQKITSIIFSDDNQRFVSGSEDGTILIWDLNEILKVDDNQDNNQGRAIITQVNPATQNNSKSEKSAQEIARKALASTVFLKIQNANGDVIRYGSGFFVGNDKLVTNFHIVDGSTSILLRKIGYDKWYQIEDILGTDEEHDLAILKLSSISSPFLPIANSETVQTGETVYVIGNPKLLEGTFSKGIVSAVRTDGKNKWIQIDASISPGSSGGAVVNGIGEVIGVVSWSYNDPKAQNLNFIVPSNYLKELLKRTK
ncbi:MAG: trypsin-like peptidase domain-containing protein [Candidatus Poribacteria bacterium]|nr:trypsin-like peptidase domain-containing protein [Candidatus Poribacteria bacterium]